MKYLIVLLFVVSCLVPEQSKDKALSGGGGDKTSAELEKDKKKLTKEQEQERNNAKKTFNKRCGKVLTGAKWKRGVASDGFFIYETKSLACEHKQLVLIDVDVSHYMNSHYITCSKTANKRLLLTIPKSLITANRQIEADCHTRILDIGIDKGKLLVSTIEKNGATQRAVIDQEGRWDGKVSELAQGLSVYKLNDLYKRIEELHRAGTLGYKIEKMAESALKGALIGATAGVTLILGDQLLSSHDVKGRSSTKAHVGVVGGFAIAGSLIAMGFESNNLDDKEKLHDSVLTIVQAYKRRAEES